MCRHAPTAVRPLYWQHKLKHNYLYPGLKSVNFNDKKQTNWLTPNNRINIRELSFLPPHICTPDFSFCNSWLPAHCSTQLVTSTSAISPSNGNTFRHLGLFPTLVVQVQVIKKGLFYQLRRQTARKKVKMELNEMNNFSCYEWLCMSKGNVCLVSRSFITLSIHYTLNVCCWLWMQSEQRWYKAPDLIDVDQNILKQQCPRWHWFKCWPKFNSAITRSIHIHVPINLLTLTRP